MAIRTDITIDWAASPRIITVDAPSVAMVMQDLLDTLRNEESKPLNMDDPSIVSASGKEPLGGGVLVGLTVTLQNARLAFEARPGPEYVSCDAGGGNLVAIDGIGADLNPIYPTAFTQVVKTSSASATLSDLEAIQYSSYQNSVWFDANSDNAGVDFPSGTREHPCNNIPDCVLIAVDKGFDTIRLLQGLTFTAADDISNMTIVGRNAIQTSIVIQDGANVTNCEFQEVTISGVLDGGNIFRQCIVDGISYVNGVIFSSAITGTLITLGGNNSIAMFLDCYSAVPGAGDTPKISFGVDDTSLAIRNWAGGIELFDKTNTAECSIDMLSGQVVVDNSCVAGTITVRGVAKLIDNTSGLCTVDYAGLLDPTYIQQMTFENAVHFDATNGTAGTIYPIGTPTNPANNVPEALTIAGVRGLHAVHVTGEITLSATDFPSYSGGTVIGKSHVATKAILDGVVFTESIFKEIIVEGAFGSGSDVSFRACVIDSTSGLHYDAHGCTIKGTLLFDNVDQANYFNDCSTGDIAGEETILDFSNSVAHVVMQNLNGRVRLMNMNNAARGISSINMNSGKVTIDPSCTEGHIRVRGVGELDDQSTGNCSVDNDVVDAYDVKVNRKHATNKAVISPDGLTVTIYEDDQVTPLQVFSISADNKIRIPV